MREPGSTALLTRLGEFAQRLSGDAQRLMGDATDVAGDAPSPDVSSPWWVSTPL